MIDSFSKLLDCPGCPNANKDEEKTSIYKHNGMFEKPEN
ncbi:hypothetical protein PRJ_5620 (plasmid) [Pseudomonas sp. XWY-1]|nr:hypothetical protein PRJ_5620 [Pseudomonas sp. XWY-1]